MVPMEHRCHVSWALMSETFGDSGPETWRGFLAVLLLSHAGHTAPTVLHSMLPAGHKAILRNMLPLSTTGGTLSSVLTSAVTTVASCSLW